MTGLEYIEQLMTNLMTTGETPMDQRSGYEYYKALIEISKSNIAESRKAQAILDLIDLKTDMLLNDLNIETNE